MTLTSIGAEIATAGACSGITDVVGMVGPAFAVLPSVTPESGNVGTTFQILAGAVTGSPAPTLAVEAFLDGVDVTASIQGGEYTATASGALEFRFTAQNAAGAMVHTVTSSVDVATTSENSVRFGAQTEVGRGGFDTSVLPGGAISEGLYGEFAVDQSGILTPAVSPLSAGTHTVDSLQIDVPANAATVSSWSEIVPFLDGTNNWSAGGTIFLRPGVYDNLNFNFTNLQKDMGPTVIEGEDPSNPPVLNKWQWFSTNAHHFDTPQTFRNIEFYREQPKDSPFWGPQSATVCSIFQNYSPVSNIVFESLTIHSDMLPANQGGVMIGVVTGIFLRKIGGLGANITIRDCVMYNLAHGVSIEAADSRVEWNTFYNTHGDAVDFGGGIDGMVLANNHFYDIGGDPASYHSDFGQGISDGYNLEFVGNTGVYGHVGKRPFAQGDATQAIVRYLTNDQAWHDGLSDAEQGRWEIVTSLTLDSSHSGIEFQIKPKSDADFPVSVPPAASALWHQFFLRRPNDDGNGTITISLSSGDTHEIGDVQAELAAKGSYIGLLSDGSNVWKKNKPGRRVHMYVAKSSRVLAEIELNKTVLVDTSDNDVTITLPAGDAGQVYHVRRIFPDTGAAKLNCTGADLIAGAPEIDLEMGQSFDLTWNGSGWDLHEDIPTFQVFFSNWAAHGLKLHANAFLSSGVAVRFEKGITNGQINNNAFAIAQTVAPPPDSGPSIDVDGDVVSFANVTQGDVWLKNGGRSLNDVAFGLYRNDALTPIFEHFNMSSAAEMNMTTRQEVIAAFRPNPAGPLANSLVGPFGLSDNEGYYNPTTGTVNLANLTAPTVSATVPPAGSHIGVSDPIEFTFDQFIKVGAGNLELRRVADDSLIETINVDTATISGRTLGVQPTMALPDTEQFYVVLDAGIVIGHHGKPSEAVGDPNAFRFQADSSVSTVFDTVDVSAGYLHTPQIVSDMDYEAKAFLLAFRVCCTDAAPNFQNIAQALRGVSLVEARRQVGHLEVLAYNGTTNCRFDNVFPVESGISSTIFVSIDGTAATLAEGLKVFHADTPLTPSSTKWGTSSGSYRISDITQVRLFEGLQATGRGWNGLSEMVWLHAFADASLLPDISVQAVRDSFGAGEIGANGEGPMGSAPLVYLAGNAATISAADNNKGTGADFSLTGSISDA